jgi:hypothetical protein
METCSDVDIAPDRDEGVVATQADNMPAKETSDIM